MHMSGFVSMCSATAWLRSWRAHRWSLPRIQRPAAVLAVVALVVWTQLFLGVHELSHLGQRDASACRFALVVSTVGGGDLPAQLVLVVPFAYWTLAPLPVFDRELVGAVLTQQARAPPLA